MLKQVLLLLLLVFDFSAIAKINVIVSISPQKFLVDEIGKDKVNVTVIIPSWANFHTYEPSPKQVMALKEGKIWFLSGERFEDNVKKILSRVDTVDLRSGIDLIRFGNDVSDLHIWLSPRLLKIQAETIANALINNDLENKEFYEDNLKSLNEKLADLDLEMRIRLESAPKNIFVSHPAFGYLCRDYGLNQFSIERDGREPTARHLIKLLIQARELKIKSVFIQTHHAMNGGKWLASKLGARSVLINPYAENVIDNLREITKEFCRE